jgi:hypothetical protein
MEKHRDFPPAVVPPDSKVGKPGLVVSQAQGKNIYLKDVIRVSKLYTPKAKLDALILFGYLWDSELHLRCIAYLILARDLNLPDRLPPIRILNGVGSHDFESKCLEVIERINTKTW